LPAGRVFAGSDVDPGPGADRSEQVIGSVHRIAPSQRDLYLKLAAVAESARNLDEVKRKSGSGWASTIAARRVVSKLQADEANLKHACG
jgi:hypothetical protein